MQTPPGRGGIAVIALSGPRTDEILRRAFRPWGSRDGREGPARPRAGRQVRRPSAGALPDGALRLGHLIDGDRVIDEAVVTRRGDAAEINIHGGPAAARATLHLLARLGATVAPAPPAAVETFGAAHPNWANPVVGEELLAAVPAARSPRVLAALTHQWSGGISQLAHEGLEACGGRSQAGGAELPRLADRLRAAADRLKTIRRLLDPAEVVLAGPPNAGKSALANALIGREVSIVHDRAGTTRDWVRELALLDGLPVYLTDTAGLWQVPKGVDAEAVRRARRRIRRADLVLLLGPGRASDVPTWLGGEGDRADRKLLHVATKCDIRPPFDGADAAVAAVTGEGLDELTEIVLRALGLADFDPAAAAAFTPRQADLLTRAANALASGRAAAAEDALRRLLGT